MNILEKWMLDKPTAASMDDWDNWHSQAKENFPVRYCLQEGIPSWYRSNIYCKLIRPITENWYKQKCTYLKDYQRHIIYTDLPANYHDQIERILHGTMTCLVEFIDNEADTTDWEGTGPEALEAYNIMIDVYDWWTINWPNRGETDIHGVAIPEYPTSPPGAGAMWIFSNSWAGTEEHKEWKQVADAHNKAEAEWNDLEEKQLIRIMKIRQYMWS